MSIYKDAPAWCKDAVPTSLGWTHPKTGELLVAVKLDVESLEIIKQSNPKVTKTEVEETEEQTEVKETEEPVEEVKPEPRRRTRSRRK